MKKINLAKTRILLFETLAPIYKNLPELINTDSYEIVAIIDNESSCAYPYPIPVISFSQILDFSFWDLLLVNDRSFTENICKMLAVLGIPEERSFFLRDEINQDEIPFYRNLFDTNSDAGKTLDYSCRKQGQNYFAVSTRGGDYITLASDHIISKSMFRKKESFSQEEVDLFISLAEQYYGIRRDERGFFFDIGANIGTTCIYAKKYVVPNMSVL